MRVQRQTGGLTGDLWLNTKLLWLGKLLQNDVVCSRSPTRGLILCEGEFEIPHIWTSCLQCADLLHLKFWLISTDKLWTEWEQKWPVQVLTMCSMYVSVTALDPLDICDPLFICTAMIWVLFVTAVWTPKQKHCNAQYSYHNMGLLIVLRCWSDTFLPMLLLLPLLDFPDVAKLKGSSSTGSVTDKLQQWHNNPSLGRLFKNRELGVCVFTSNLLSRSQ